ncbi:MAG: exodeoxyribonuclease VII large subunit [Candidatus Cloacimonadaceae bacterium]|jgi:exodeoxyribonuclease VII large subunit|nr:exodeoxyribonuclease VII large subunit [Candidatus Cloacimonadaceae bacterium]
MDSHSVFSVFEVSRHLRQVIESSIAPLYVKGEISNFVHHSSGHMYFNLKDEFATLRCTFFRNSNYKLDFKPADGQSVVCFGKITLYEKGGSYNLNVSTMMPAGLGDMQARFEALKKKLQEEGLFDPSNKKKLPPYPQTIGIVTSPTSAALQDVKNILQRRYPVEAYVYPALVQGTEAAQTLIRGIRYFNDVLPVDLIILTRGGGSQEDLFCFNDEALARAIHASRIPLISAVGHEIDFTISDFVADLRAPTPSAAAEIAVPNKDDLLAYCGSLRQRLHLAMQHASANKSSELNDAKHKLSGYHPQRLWQDYQQRFDMASLALMNIQHLIKDPQYRLERSQSRFLAARESKLTNRMNEYRYQLSQAELALKQQSKSSLQEKQQKLELLMEALQQQSPQTIMQKGWLLAIKNGKLLRTVKDIKPGDQLQLNLHDGKADVLVETTIEDSQ